MTVQENWVEDNYIMGQDAALFYAGGGSMHALNNSFMRIGSLSNETFSQDDFNNKTRVPAKKGNETEPMVYAPYFGVPFNSNLTVNLTQEKGIFWFEAGAINRTNTSMPIKNSFEHNNFTLVFCQQGCIYS